MKKRVKNGVMCGMIFVLSFACYFLVGARFDLAKSVEATPSVEDVITIAPMAVEDEFSTTEEVVVADEKAESVVLAMPTFTGKMELSIPVNGIALYRQDPDDTLRTIRWDEVYDQYTVAQYSANGFVKGNQAAQHYLINRYVSRQVAAYGYDVVNSSLVPEEARELVRNDFANFFIGKITRLSNDGKAVTLNCEPYEGEDVHHAVVNILVGEKATEYWTIFVRDDGVWTLCTEKAHHGYFGNNDAPSQPSQPSQPQDDVDPAPVWEDPSDDVDPAPVWEDPSDPTPVDPTPVQDWDPDFNFNQDPAPVWEDDSSSNTDPAPIWEDVSAPSSDPVPTTSGDWDSNLNLSDNSSSGQNYDPAPVWEDNSAPSSAAVSSTESSWDSNFNLESSVSYSVETSYVESYSAPAESYSAPAESYSAPAESYSAPAESYSAPVWDNPVSDSSSSGSSDSGWDSDFNF